MMRKPTFPTWFQGFQPTISLPKNLQPARQQHLHRFTAGTIDSSDELLATWTAAGIGIPGGFEKTSLINCEDFFQCI